MKQAKPGDTVKVDYRGFIKNGKIIDTSIGKKPLEFVIGQGKINKLFEKAVEGMSVGEIKTIQIPPEYAYGKYREDLVFKVEKSKMPSNMNLKKGMNFSHRSKEGKNLNLTLTEISENAVTLNGNHPYAGLTLKYEIKLQGIK